MQRPNSSFWLSLPFLLFVAGSAVSGCGSTDAVQGDEPEEVEPGSSVSDDPESGTPGGTSAGPIAPPAGEGRADGASCSSDEQCAGGVCIRGGGWAGGYCSANPCTNPSADCNPGEAPSACLVIDVTELPWCARTCEATSDCRNGYVCDARGIGGTSVCVPADDTPPDPRPTDAEPPVTGTPPVTDPPPITDEPPVTGTPPVTEPSPTDTPRVDGEACQVDSDCIGGTCLQHPEWPGGYCTTAGCARFTDCAREDASGEEFDNRCLTRQNAPNLCVRICSGASDCRTGYECRPIGQGNAYCAPAPDTTPEPTEPAPPGDGSIGDACTDDTDCGDLSCATGFQYPGGYCTVTGCTDDTDCGTGAFCQSFFGFAASCVATCSRDSDCRDGYSCSSIPGSGNPDGCIADFGGGGGGGGFPFP